MSKLMKLLAMMLALAVLAAACGSDEPETPAADPEPDEPEADEPEAEEPEAMEEDEPVEVALADMSWDQVLAQAQEEGELNWFHWYLQERIRPFVEQFEEETGISINVSDGDFQANEDKLLAESDRDTGDIDVMSYTFEKMAQLDMGAMFMSLDQLPDIGNLTTEGNGVDTDNRGVAWWGNQTGFAYDKNRVDEADLPQTFDELTAWIAANPQGFGVNDPSMGGAGNSFAHSVVREFSGSGDYFDDELDDAKVATWAPASEWLASIKDDIVVTGNNADTLTRMNDGEFMLGPAWEDQLAGLQIEGEIGPNIGFYIPEFGMNGGANSILIPANSANPAAALVFIDWISSPEIQAELNKDFGVAPQHPDASDEFALASADQRAFRTRWFSQPYIDLAVSTFVDAVIGA